MHGRGVYRPKTGPVPLPPKVIDVAEDASLVQRRRHRVQLTGLDMVAYRNRVHRILQDIIDENATLQKIKAGLPVEPAELESLCSLVLTLDAGLDLHDLADYFPETARHLDQAIRGIIGLDAHTSPAGSHHADPSAVRRDSPGNHRVLRSPHAVNSRSPARPKPRGGHQHLAEIAL